MSDNLTTDARRQLAKLRSYVRRQGLTGWVDRSARWHYQTAFAAVVRVEDAHGIAAAAALADRLTALRHEATAAGLLTPGDVGAAEAEALREVARHA